MKIFIATGNLHKLTELKGILPEHTALGEPIHYVSVLDEPSFVMPEETADTLTENAQLKALAGAHQTGLVSLSDDTGLEVDALGGGPGVHTARYAGENASSQDNNEKLLRSLQGVPLEKRTARFRTIACLAYPDGKTYCFEGQVQGYIASDYHGINGFGYDPIFVVTETGKAFAEMSEADKNKLSHRGRAFRKLAEFLTHLSD